MSNDTTKTFKIGDMVVGGEHDHIKPGKVVYAGKTGSRRDILVDWGSGFVGHNGNDVMHLVFPTTTHWWEVPSDLKPAKSYYIKKFKEDYERAS